MSHRKVVISGCAVVATIFSLSVNAATRTDGLNACAQAVVTKLGDAQSVPINFSLAPETETSGIRLKNREIFHMDFLNPGSDKVIAKVDCTVDRKANIRSLKYVPLDGKDAVARADS